MLLLGRCTAAASLVLLLRGEGLASSCSVACTVSTQHLHAKDSFSLKYLLSCFFQLNPIIFMASSADNIASSISGYLYKRTRDGRWQKRWFETNGVYLTYYKSRKMEKLLAALSLPQVGEIKLVPPDQDPENHEGLFSIELNTRIYVLRGKSLEEAEQWVKVLNKLRDDGIHANIATQTPLAGANVNQSLGQATQAKSQGDGTEWIKSGKSCFCC